MCCCALVDRVDIFQLLAVLVWTAFANRHQKLKCTRESQPDLVAFAMFDFDRSGSVSLDELVIFFVASCKGIGRLTRAAMPKKAILQEIATTQFLIYDINNNKLLELDEYHSAGRTWG